VFLPAGDAVISGVCDFDLGITVLENNEYITTFFDQEGNVTRRLIPVDSWLTPQRGDR
jgi:hypothetical protein